MVDLAPVCKEDLVLLPKALAKHFGGIGPMVLVYKISKYIHILDINTMQTYEVDESCYWNNPFKALLGRESLTEFVVTEVEQIDTNMNDSRAALKQRFHHCRLQVQRLVDFKQNETKFSVFSHLGGVLSAGDRVMGYDLAQINSRELDEFFNQYSKTK